MSTCPANTKDERGASAILLALMMVALLAFAALTIDVGRIYWERAQLQNGADAGAIALASICGKYELDSQCSPTSSVAPTLGNANANDGMTTIDGVDIDTAANKVVVRTGAKENGASANSISLTFAQILDPSFAEVAIGASATARWGSPTQLKAKFPMAFSKCEVDSSPTYDGGLQFLMSHGVNDTGGATDACHSTGSGQEIPGGFGWLQQEPSGSCSTQTAVDGWETTDVGNDMKDGCLARLKEWQGILEAGETIETLLPVFDAVSGTGSNGAFHVHGYAAFQIMGWQFKNNDPVLDYLPGSTAKVIKDGGYKNSDRGFVGKFVRYVFDDEDAVLGGDTSPYGANIIKLTD